MKVLLSAVFLSACLLCAGTASAQSVISFNYASIGSAAISFDGAGHIDFLPDAGTGHEFQISGANLPGLNGLQGNITGTFGIGPVTTLSTSPLIQDALVSGKRTFSIFDGTTTLTADVWWASALTVGTVGALNPNGVLNLNNFSYSGTNSALQALATESLASNSVSFQFLPALSLSTLATGGAPNATTFSGSFSAIPEPSTYAALLGGTVSILVALRRRPGLAA